MIATQSRPRPAIVLSAHPVCPASMLWTLPLSTVIGSKVVAVTVLMRLLIVCGIAVTPVEVKTVTSGLAGISTWTDREASGEIEGLAERDFVSSASPCSAIGTPSLAGSSAALGGSCKASAATTPALAASISSGLSTVRLL